MTAVFIRKGLEVRTHTICTTILNILGDFNDSDQERMLKLNAAARGKTILSSLQVKSTNKRLVVLGFVLTYNKVE